MLQAGAKLKQIRLRLGLSVREVERLSLKVVSRRENRDFFLSRAWITDIEKGRFVPGIFKIAALSDLYRLTIQEIHVLYGIQPGDITKDPTVFAPPKTHLLALPEEAPLGEVSSVAPDVRTQFEHTDLLSRLVDIWGDVPVPLLRQLDLRRSLYGYIGTKDKTMSPLLPPGTFVRIDPKQTRVKNGPAVRSSSPSQFSRPIYFLDIRTGYACGWCEVKDGVLTLIPHPDSGQQTRTFRYPDEVDVVGRVTGIAMPIEEESLVRMEELMRQKSPPKK